MPGLAVRGAGNRVGWGRLRRAALLEAAYFGSPRRGAEDRGPEVSRLLMDVASDACILRFRPHIALPVSSSPCLRRTGRGKTLPTKQPSVTLYSRKP